MSKLILCITLLATSTALFADAAKKKPLTEAEKAARREMRLKMTGGSITKEGKGKTVIVNAQKKYSTSDLERALQPFKDQLRTNFEIRNGSWSMGTKRPDDAAIALYVVDDATLPMSLVAMEDRWGVMNVSTLDTPQRFDREFMRVAVATLGAGVSQYRASPMQTVRTAADLDSLIGCALTIDCCMGMKNNLEKLGVTASQMTTYRRACQEGWAPAPTNDYQKAIWEKVHELPTEPVKIEFNPKKDK